MPIHCNGKTLRFNLKASEIHIQRLHSLQAVSNFLPTLLHRRPRTLLRIDGMILDILGKFDHMNESHFKTFIQDNVTITFTFQTGNSKKLKGQVIRLQANWGPHIQEVKTNAYLRQETR